MNGNVKNVGVKEYNGKTYHSFLSNEVWYSTGMKKLVEKGDTITFDAEQNDKGFWNAKNIVKSASAPATTSSGSTSTGTNWAKKDELDQKRFEFDQQKHYMICQQAARNAANALIGLAVQTGLEGAPDSYTKLVAESNKLTKQFYDLTVNLGASIGSSTAPPKAPPAEPEFVDPLPF